MNNKEIVRTRFAPSPTGYLHIGGARTAIFNWLYARRFGGSFILRIEDTDQTRSTEDSIEQIIEAMDWLGLDHDEGPYRQTERQGRYKVHVDKLLDAGHAYRCVCSKEELDVKREAMIAAKQKPKYDGVCRGKNIPADTNQPFVVRFDTPKSGVTKVDDMLRGIISFDNDQLDDMIIMRADGTPTYNFCVVVDDAEMNITHVIRGDDHLANTPRQAVIYEALGLDVPKFAHVSMILGNDGKRLSKRHGALSVLEYRDKGILPEALVNYLVRLGWSHGDQEVFSMDELKSLYDLDAVGKGSARFDEEKLLWINAEHIKTTPDETLGAMIANILMGDGIEASVGSIVPLLPMLRQRAQSVTGLAESMKYFFVDKVAYEEKAAKKFLTDDICLVLKELVERFGDVDFSDTEAIESEFKSLLESKGLKLKHLAQPVRVALTGGTVSPGLFGLLSALGKEKSVNRIKAAISFIVGK